jgi:membrane fusion protein (multidrug efflux system)
MVFATRINSIISPKTHMPATRSIFPLAVPVLLILSLSACQQGNNSAPAKPQTSEVSVVTLKPQDVTLSTVLPGRTNAYLTAEIRPQVSGILQKRLFAEGAEVRAGQPLYQIDSSTYQATYDHAQASLEAAKLLSDRYDQLIQRQAISQQDRDNARSQYLQAGATLEAAQIDLGHTRITAPISGRIGRSSVTPGALLTANQATALATVQQLDPIYVDISQPSTALLRLRDELANGQLKKTGAGQAEVHLTLENGKAYAYAGKLQFSEVSVDEGTGAVTLRAVFPNPDRLLLPGMYVRAALEEGVRSQALLVPQRGITRDSNGQPTALVVVNGKVEQRKVAIDRAIGGDWLVTDGLKAGDSVVVDGLQGVHPGDSVNATPVVPGSAASRPQA